MVIYLKIPNDKHLFLNPNKSISMNPPRKYRKFTPQQKKIEDLEKQSPLFKRIYSEYELMSDELWDLENSDITNIPDDFLNAVKLQTEYLEEEIDDWLINRNSAPQPNI